MPEGIQIRSLDDVPGMATQRTNPGMQIQPLTPAPMQTEAIDNTGISPVYNPQQALDALKAVQISRSEQIAASAKALEQNTIVSQTLLDTVTREQNKTMDAYERVQRIARNPLADLFAVFDPRTWSTKHQLLDIEISQLTVQEQSMQAQSQMNINNQLPALKATEVELAQAGFQNQKDAFGIIKDVSELTQKQVQLRINAAQLRIAMSQEERTVWDTKAKQLSTDQARAQLKAAKSGKGEWAGKEGILEDIIDRAEKRDLDEKSIRQALAASQFDLAEKKMASLVRNETFTNLSQSIEQALASQSNFITIGKTQVPLATAILGAEDVRKNTEAFEQASFANSLYSMNEDLQLLTRQNSALALVNPKAARNLQLLNQITADKSYQTNPQNAARVQAAMKHIKTETAEAGKQAASSFKTPEAKAGMQEFFDTGAFTPTGGQAVVTEALGNTGIMARSKFPTAWNAVNVETARRIDQLNISGAPAFDGSNQSAQQMMTYFLINRNKKVDDIKAEIIQSGFGNDVVANEVTKTYRTDAIKNVLDSLSTTGANAGTFLNLIRSPATYTDPEGKIDTQSLAAYLAQQSILTGNKVDYTDAFITALKTYGTQADSITADPGMTAEDQALLSKSFGGDPRRNIINEFTSEMATQSTIMNRAMQDAIKQDLSGQTQRRAISNLSPELDPASAGQIVQSTPSATGIGTAEEIKAIFGTDPRFGGAIQPKGGK